MEGKPLPRDDWLSAPTLWGSVRAPHPPPTFSPPSMRRKVSQPRPPAVLSALRVGESARAPLPPKRARIRHLSIAALAIVVGDEVEVLDERLPLLESFGGRVLVLLGGRSLLLLGGGDGAERLDQLRERGRR